MAQNLLRKGYELTVYDIVDKRVEVVGAESPDIIITIVFWLVGSPGLRGGESCRPQ